MALTKVPTQMMGAGAVLQVVQGTTSTAVVNNSSSYTATGLSAIITPSSASSKVLVIAEFPYTSGTNGGNAQLEFLLARNGATISSAWTVNNVQYIVQMGGLKETMVFLDSPSSTSALTYNIDFREYSMSNRYGNSEVMSGTRRGTITLLEVAA